MKNVILVNHTDYIDLDELLPKLNGLETQYSFNIRDPGKNDLYESSFGAIVETELVLEKAKEEYDFEGFTIVLLDSPISNTVLVESNIAILSVFCPTDELIYKNIFFKMVSFICLLFEHGENYRIGDSSDFDDAEIMRRNLAELNNKYISESYAALFAGIDTGNCWKEKRVVLITHGFNTHGHWQEKAKIQLEGEFDIKGIVRRYTFVTLIMFLIPYFRKKFANDILGAIDSMVLDYPNHKYSIIAHSFGTLIIARALENASELNSNLNIDRLILNGGIIARDYNWEQFMKGSSVKVDKILNVCGDSDFWPILSRSFVLGTGDSGAYFFSENSKKIVNIRLKKIWHSGMLTDNAYRALWGKFICNEELPLLDALPPRWHLGLLGFATRYMYSKLVYIILFCVLSVVMFI